MCTRTYGLMNVLVPPTSDCSSRGAEPRETTSDCVIERLTLACIQQRVAFRSQHRGGPLRFLTHGNGAGVWLPKSVATVSASHFKSPLLFEVLSRLFVAPLPEAAGRRDPQDFHAHRLPPHGHAPQRSSRSSVCSHTSPVVLQTWPSAVHRGYFSISTLCLTASLTQA